MEHKFKVLSDIFIKKYIHFCISIMLQITNKVRFYFDGKKTLNFDGP